MTYVYNKCEVAKCLKSGEPRVIDGINYILCDVHAVSYGLKICCLGCRCMVETYRDWESYTLLCSNCDQQMNDNE